MLCSDAFPFNKTLSNFYLLSSTAVGVLVRGCIMLNKTHPCPWAVLWVEWWLPKRYVHIPESMNVSSFGKGVLTDGMKGKILR